MTIDQEGYRVQKWGEAPVWEAFPVPAPGPGEALVRVSTCGVGLTVLNCIRGDLSDDPSLLPRVPGHELVGRVESVGVGAPSELVGRLVTAYFYLSCGSCPECMAGLDSRCRRLAGWVGVHRDGGYAPWAVLPAHNAIVLPEGIDPVAATVAADAVATPLHVCGRRAKVGPEDRVAVIGAGGGVGIHMVQVARLYGGRVVGLDLTDDKLATLEELDITPIDARDLSNLDPALWEEGPPTVVIDLVGTAATLAWSVDALATGGRMVVLTTFRDISTPLDPRQLVFREAEVMGSRYATRREVATAAELVASGRIRPMIGEVVGPDGIPDLHARLEDRRLVGRGALRWEGTA